MSPSKIQKVQVNKAEKLPSFYSNLPGIVLTQNLHLTPSTQQPEQASFTREKISRRASQFSLKINKRQSS
jgi:hypothetical protein